MKRLTLNETWKLCLAMWRWIARQVRAGRNDVDVSKLKDEWLAKKGFDPMEILHSCFFCHYTTDSDLEDCEQCPGRKVDPYFGCCGGKYYYRFHPIAFYNKLVRLNRKRLKK